MHSGLKSSINSVKDEIARTIKERKVSFIVPVYTNELEPVEEMELTDDQLVDYVLKLVDKVSGLYEGNMLALANRLNQIVIT